MSAPLLRPNLSDDHDDIVCLHGLTWAQFEAILEARGERAAPRITYLEGELELRSPGPSHERIKTVIARLLEVWGLECDVVIEGVGSWTLRREDKERGVEPDECYFVGRTDGDAPDLAIEVVWSHGSIDKLSVCGPLGVREVWIWEDGRVTIHALRGEGYVVVARSEVLPSLDLEAMLRHADPLAQDASARAWRKALRERRG
jgi:Uma2 family endonuclease